LGGECECEHGVASGVEWPARYEGEVARRTGKEMDVDVNEDGEDEELWDGDGVTDWFV
jgi:hypothetical protein